MKIYENNINGSFEFEALYYELLALVYLKFLCMFVYTYSLGLGPEGQADIHPGIQAVAN